MTPDVKRSDPSRTVAFAAPDSLGPGPSMGGKPVRTLKLVMAVCLLCLAGCLSPAVDAAQNRCLQYGFQGQNALAHCTELESNAPPTYPIGFGQINAAQDQCLVLGYKGNALADCTQRHVRAVGP